MKKNLIRKWTKIDGYYELYETYQKGKKWISDTITKIKINHISDFQKVEDYKNKLFNNPRLCTGEVYRDSREYAFFLWDLDTYETIYSTGMIDIEKNIFQYYKEH